ncbi:AbiEi antitoxin N-terminal domain-containing protein [Ilumatobacter nonamiensis]|uniref:AbiEi antitoxin N-terminal domain-containing protein n=1 Tax=Ilumatobacter nonamiensis TaxID=467093 RepID=UPI00034A9F53|nr:AbiEi antitoxin N-terminal domain-containing protein [Ilumatobacter nonamiensis]
MTKLPVAAHRTMAGQHGVVSSHQLHAHGLSTRQIHHLAQSGQLIHVERGAYATPSVELDELGRCAAVCLARPAVAIAGPTAGRLWGFRHVQGDRRIHVIGPPHSQPASRPGVAVYRTAAIHGDDIVLRPDGIRVTSRARTALDLARHLSPDLLLSVMEQAMHDGNLSESEMRTVAVDWMSPQRPWLFTFLRQLERRVAGPAAESGPEVDLGQALEAAGVTGLVRQYEVELPGYGRARFDLAVPALRWAVEVDVHPVHEQTIGHTSDRRRDAGAVALGWLVNRVSRAEFRASLDTVVAHLVEVYRARSAASR